MISSGKPGPTWISHLLEGDSLVEGCPVVMESMDRESGCVDSNPSTALSGLLEVLTCLSLRFLHL